VVTSAAAADEVLIWRAANSDTKRITKANYIGATFTGAGTIATGGFTLTLGSTSAINGNITGGGTLALGGFTLTVPATGTASLLGTAQTSTALKTFSSGINLGQSLNFDYYNGGNWTPVVADAASGGNVATLGSSLGVYQRFGLTVHVTGWMGNIDTTGLTAGNDLYIRGLPFVSMTATNYFAVGSANINRAALTGYFTVYVQSNKSVLNVAKITSGADAANMIVSSFTDDVADIAFSLTYFCAP
jgi:hypothetical protein